MNESIFRADLVAEILNEHEPSSNYNKAICRWQIALLSLEETWLKC